MEYFPQQFVRRHLQIKVLPSPKKGRNKKRLCLYLCGSAKATVMEGNLEQNNNKERTSSSG